MLCCCSWFAHAAQPSISVLYTNSSQRRECSFISWNMHSASDQDYCQSAGSCCVISGAQELSENKFWTCQFLGWRWGWWLWLFQIMLTWNRDEFRQVVDICLEQRSEHLRSSALTQLSIYTYCNTLTTWSYPNRGSWPKQWSQVTCLTSDWIHTKHQPSKDSVLFQFWWEDSIFS